MCPSAPQHATLLSEVLWELPYMWGSTSEPGSTSDSCLWQLRANSQAPPTAKKLLAFSLQVRHHPMAYLESSRTAQRRRGQVGGVLLLLGELEVAGSQGPSPPAAPFECKRSPGGSGPKHDAAPPPAKTSPQVTLGPRFPPLGRPRLWVDPEPRGRWVRARSPPSQ